MLDVAADPRVPRDEDVLEESLLQISKKVGVIRDNFFHCYSC